MLECWKEGLYWQGIVHDFSKFSSSEFPAYAWNFFANLAEQAATKDRIQQDFFYAWLHHQHHNKHHWNYWVVNQNKKEALPMPEKYLLEMICDWRAMGRKFGDTAQDFFEKNHQKMVLHPETLERVQQILCARAVHNNALAAESNPREMSAELPATNVNR